MLKEQSNKTQVNQSRNFTPYKVKFRYRWRIGLKRQRWGSKREEHRQMQYEKRRGLKKEIIENPGTEIRKESLENSTLIGHIDSRRESE